MIRALTFILVALGFSSAALLAVAQEEMIEAGVGTPVTWTVQGTPVNSATSVAIVENPNFGFELKDTTIAVGATVIWTNTGQSPHTVSANDNSFDSGIGTPLGHNGTFTHTFTTAGDFSYRCKIHPSMQGTIHVS